MGCQRMEITRCGTCSTLSLFFHIDIAQSTPGEHLHVVGSHEGLGAWNPDKGARLTTNERTYPVWRSRQIELRCAPEDSSTVLVLKYKYVLDRRELKQGFLWEESIPDREVQIPWSQDCDCAVWLIRDSAFNREGATKVTKLAPGAKLLRSPQQETSEGLISVPEETPEAEEPTETPLFDAKYALVGRRPFAKGGFSSVWRCRRQGSAGVGTEEFAAKRIDLAGPVFSKKLNFVPAQEDEMYCRDMFGETPSLSTVFVDPKLCWEGKGKRALVKGYRKWGWFEDRPWAHQDGHICPGSTCFLFMLWTSIVILQRPERFPKRHADEEDSGCMDPVANEDTRLWLRILLEVLQVVRIDGALFIVQCGDDPNVPSDQALFQGELDDRNAPWRVPWAQKKPVVYWRGALTVPDNIAMSEAQHLPRFRVFQVASMRNELFDVGVSSIDGELIAAWGKKDFAKVAPRYRYLLNLNGVVSSWHYVPVSASLDDLIELVTTLEGNETLAKQIAEAGADFYARRVRPEDAYCMALRTLEVSQLPEALRGLLAWKRFHTLHVKGKRCIFGHGVQPGEIRLHQNLHHPNIVELIDTFHDDSSKMVSLVLEFCKGGDLLEVMSRHREKNSKGLRESATRRAMKHTFQALAYLHEQGVVHRDVKCENVFKVEAPNTVDLEDCTYKLGDFGLAACVMPDEVLMDQVGSPSTSAPEVVRGRPYGKPADMWSAGAAIYTLLAGRRPFEASSYMQMVRVMSKVEVSFSDDTWSRTSKAAVDLLGELMQAFILQHSEASVVPTRTSCMHNLLRLAASQTGRKEGPNDWRAIASSFLDVVPGNCRLHPSHD
ncbi:CDPK-related kinase 1 [Symbiodinium microadriaticum]|uniref:CDPK-related kinase 1 n=1 Tax=Symbiodinium microadriaticum TaxID=2951 RepID=A0A1Q9EBP8_SYMMI|nr:CDPK-related kinase 1 [Symbiodinium microadriaticum]